LTIRRHLVRLRSFKFEIFRLFLEEIFMASRTAVTENRRKAHHRAMGAKRKAANRNKGTTPKFAVHENGAPKVVKALAHVAVLKAPSAKKAKVFKVKAPKAEKAPKAAVEKKAKAPKTEKAAKPTK
jgi:hypothetical protein